MNWQGLDGVEGFNRLSAAASRAGAVQGRRVVRGESDAGQWCDTGRRRRLCFCSGFSKVTQVGCVQAGADDQRKARCEGGRTAGLDSSGGNGPGR